VVGLDRFELSTPRLSSVCSNQLSYRPPRKRVVRIRKNLPVPWKLNRDEITKSFVDLRTADPRGVRAPSIPRSLRKEVIQPQVLLQLPCYDFTPITDHTLSGCVPCGFAHRFLVQPTFVM
jgi:hypothetical protein